jgi:hypothetical protein
MQGTNYIDSQGARNKRQMSNFKIKAGYTCVIDDQEEVESSNSGPSIYNVPNPPSAINEDVSKEQLLDALITHCKTTAAQREKLKASAGN